MTDWLSRDDVSRLVRVTAEATARQLGHELEPWETVIMEHQPVRIAFCKSCRARAAIRTRSFSGPAQSGTALSFRCPGESTAARERLTAARAAAGLPAPGPPPPAPAPSPSPAYGWPWGPLGRHAPPRKP